MLTIQCKIVGNEIFFLNYFFFSVGGVRLRPSLHLHLLQRSQVCEFSLLSTTGLRHPARHQGGLESSLTRPVLLRQDLDRLRPSLGGRAAATLGRQGETSSSHHSLTASQSLGFIKSIFPPGVLITPSKVIYFPLEIVI